MHALALTGSEETGRNAHRLARQAIASTAALDRRVPLDLRDAVPAEPADRPCFPITSVSRIPLQ